MVRERWRISASIGMFVVLFLLVAGAIGAQSPDQNDNDHFVYLPLVAREYDPTWAWREGITITLTPSPGGILMAIDHQRRVHLLWDVSLSPKFIYHSYLSSSGWTSPTVVASSLGFSEVMHPPAVAINDIMHLLWRNRETSNAPYRILYATFEGGQWTPEEVVFQSRYSPLIYRLQGIAKPGFSGVVHAAIVDCGLFSCDAYYTSRRDAWKPATQIDNFQFALLEGPYGKAWPDSLGGIRLYVNNNNYDLYYSYWQNGQFLVRNRPVGRVKIAGRETLSDGNNLHIFWLDKVPISGGEVTGLYHQCLDDNLTSYPVEVLSGYNPVQKVVGSTDYFGFAALAWEESEGSTARIRLGIWNGCSRLYLKTVPTRGERTTPYAVAVNGSSGTVCVLAGYSYLWYSPQLEIICADTEIGRIGVDPAN
jgi:hypothetical protein